MKKVFLFLAGALMSVFAMAESQQYNQIIWLNGRAMCATPISRVDSMTFSTELEMDTLYTLLPRIAPTVVHDTVEKVVTIIQHDTVYIDADGNVITKSKEGFSVSATKRVMFAPGNLRYTQSTMTWSFAKHQYDYIGEANTSNNRLADDIDLFGWSTTNPRAPWGISKNTYYSEFEGDFVDWGTNEIGDYAANTWRTLSSQEWSYIIAGRANAGKLFGFATVDTIHGLILLPDNWVLPEGAKFTPSSEKGMVQAEGHSYWYNEDVKVTDDDSKKNFSHNFYTLEEWAVLEAAGAVFLPASGYRRGVDVEELQKRGDYWTSTPFTNNYDAYQMELEELHLYPSVNYNRYTGMAVRLVREAK